MRDCCLKSTRNFFKKLSLSLPIIDETFWAKFSNTVARKSGRPQRRAGTRSHLIADLSTIRQSTSKISCCLSITLPCPAHGTVNNSRAIVQSHRRGHTSCEIDQLIKRNKVVASKRNIELLERHF